VLALVFSNDSDKRCSHAVFPDFFSGNAPAGHLQASQTSAQNFQFATGINQRAERHIPADSAKTIKISKFHGNLPFD
jgi:hypothetical protein